MEVEVVQVEGQDGKRTGLQCVIKLARQVLDKESKGSVCSCAGILPQCTQRITIP